MRCGKHKLILVCHCGATQMTEDEGSLLFGSLTLTYIIAN